MSGHHATVDPFIVSEHGALAFHTIDSLARTQRSALESKSSGCATKSGKHDGPYLDFLVLLRAVSRGLYQLRRCRWTFTASLPTVARNFSDREMMANYGTEAHPKAESPTYQLNNSVNNEFTG
jgi:hypothetical protein